MNNEKAIDVIVALFIVGAVVFSLDTCFSSSPVPNLEVDGGTHSSQMTGAGGFAGNFEGLGGEDAGTETQTESNNSCGM